MGTERRLAVPLPQVWGAELALPPASTMSVGQTLCERDLLSFLACHIPRTKL